MAFDGITVAALAEELNHTLTGGRIYKIAQPESDELLLTVKTAGGGQRRLYLSASASLPLVYLTESNKPSPLTAPSFCMLLRKHLQNGRITRISQPGLERVLRIHIEHLDEMGDLRIKYLIVEIMGKHSNIIFTDENDVILDSIKHISGMVSSLREVLPGRPYFIPRTQDKKDPLTVSPEEFRETILSRGMPVFKAIYGSYTGLSPLMAQEICQGAGIDGDLSTAFFTENENGPEMLSALYRSFENFMDKVRRKEFTPVICYATEGGQETPVEFSALSLISYPAESLRFFSSISALLSRYYEEKNKTARIRQKSADLRRIVQTALERNIKKYDLQLQQMKDTEKKDKYRIYGELLNTYGYQVPAGARTMEALNYYTNERITIPLDPLLSPTDNARKYFERYGKLKRTYEALSGLTVEVKEEILHLESIQTALDIAVLEEDLAQIREELVESGYLRRRGTGKKEKITSKPFHYISSDGYHMYAGKNNYQNDELTFRFASPADWWFHAKNMPGSHVIVKTEGKPLPDSTYEEAARLAAFYSKGRAQGKVEVDYTEKRNVKKPNGGKPGFVVYYTNYSMTVRPDISHIQQAAQP